MWGENSDRMVCSRTLQFDEPALLKVVLPMLCGYQIRTHVLFARPTPMLEIPNPFRASPFCSNSFGPHFEKTSEVFSTSASRSWERRSRCLSINVDTLSVDMWCSTRTRSLRVSYGAGFWLSHPTHGIDRHLVIDYRFLHQSLLPTGIWSPHSTVS
jgi:hypothetical protein